MGGRGAEIKIKTHEDTDILEWYGSGDGMWINNYLRGLNNEITLDMAQKERLLKRGQSYIPKKVYMKNGNIYVDVSMI